MMSASPWMIYGATGHTGRMIVDEAIRRGHQPILAGRSAERIRPLAESLGLPWRVIDLMSSTDLQHGLQDVRAVLLAVGPFEKTAPALLQACLATGTAYADISNEIPHLRAIQRLDAAAQQRGIPIIAGVGFGVVASNCLAKFLGEQMPDATELRCATHIAAASGSAGAAETGLEILRVGGQVIRGGRYKTYRLGRGATRIRFADEERIASPIPLGDLTAAALATGIPNITMYSTALPTGLAGSALPLVRRLLGIPAVRASLLRPSSRREDTPPTALHSQAWGWVRNATGKVQHAWLTMGDGYVFTATSSVLGMERILGGTLVGVLPPALAFGADFVLTIPGTQRFTVLEDVKDAILQMA